MRALPTPADADRFLRIYLRDHYAGSAAGLSLAGRARRSEPELDEVLGGLEREIAEDQAALRSLMARRGVAPSRAKAVIGKLTEVAARLKGNGRLARRSPLSTVVELEALAAGVLTKRNLWRALDAIADRAPVLDEEELHRLIERATDQLERIHGLHGRAAVRAFAGEVPSSSLA